MCHPSQIYIQREPNLIMSLIPVHESNLIMIDDVIILSGVVRILENFMISEEENFFLLNVETAERNIFYQVDIRYQI